jgi:uncharacterized membrane protein
MSIFLSYASALLLIGALDALWLGWLARDFYRQEIGALMLPEVQKLPAALFYLGYPAGLLALALTPHPDTLGSAVLRSALLGLVAYGAYDLTNLATLKGWSLRLALADMAWGMVLSAAAGAVAWSVAEHWARRSA